MKKLLILLALLGIMASPAAAQNYTYYTGLYFDSGTATPGTCSPPSFYFNTSTLGFLACSNDKVMHAVGGAAVTHTVTIPIAGAPIVTGTSSVGIPNPPTTFACTINKAQISANASGSITVDIWKKSLAIPSASDKISASAPVTLASAQLNNASSLTGWGVGLTISIGDVFWASVATVDGSLTNVSVVLTCQ